MKQVKNTSDSTFVMNDDDVIFVHPGIRLNQSDILALLRGDKLYTYSVNVSKNGYFLFRTEKMTNDTSANFKRFIYNMLDRFTEVDGYDLTLSLSHDSDEISLSSQEKIKAYMAKKFPEKSTDSFSSNANDKRKSVTKSKG